MFGFFKKNLSDFPQGNFDMLAAVCTSNSLIISNELPITVPYSDPDRMELFGESMAFLICVCQMRMQAFYKVTKVEQVATFLEGFEIAFSHLFDAAFIDKVRSEGVPWFTYDVVPRLNGERFMQHIWAYAARECSALGITNATFDAFCTRHGYNSMIVRGAGDVLAQVLFIIRVLPLFLNHRNSDSEGLLVRSIQGLRSRYIGEIDRCLRF